MATFLEKLQIFEKEQIKAITASFGSKPKAVKADVQKLRSWIEANKDMKSSPEVKSKLFAILEKYHRAHVNLAVLHGPLKALLQDIVQLGNHILDEDRLNEVRGWLESLKETDDEEGDDTPLLSTESAWSMEAVDLSSGLVSLVSENAPELWKENFRLPDEFIGQLGEWNSDVEQGRRVIVYLDDGTDAVLRVCQQLIN